MSKDDPAETLVLEYNLFDLPTAQHKAGLAGLLLMVESMKRRRMENVPDVRSATRSSACIAFTSAAFQSTLGDLYKGTEVQTKTGKTKFSPAMDYLNGLGVETVWIKAWQDCVCSVVRKGAALAVYGKPYTSAKEFKALLAGNGSSEKTPASLIVPGEQENAETVPVRGTRAQNFLLHFTLIPCLLFIPRFVVKNQKTHGWEESFHLNSKRRGPFFAVCVPEPADLQRFVGEVATMIRRLTGEKIGYRPREAVVHSVEEGGLEYMRQLLHERASGEETAEVLAAVEVCLLEKQGTKNIRVLGTLEAVPSRRLLAQYLAIRGSFRNPLYNTCRLRNLLAGREWLSGTDALFSHYPFDFFILSQEKTPRYIPFFGRDAKRTFQSIGEDLKHRKGASPVDESDKRSDRLAELVYRLTRAYVEREAAEKSELDREALAKMKDGRGRRVYPKKYREMREKVCTGAFLAMRGRRAEDFLEYFVGTICSIPQFLKNDEYVYLCTD